MKVGSRAGFYGQSVGRRFSFSLGIYDTVFEVEMYAILAYVYETQFQSRLENYVSAIIVGPL
jgi:hypothetical protein